MVSYIPHSNQATISVDKKTPNQSPSNTTASKFGVSSRKKRDKKRVSTSESKSYNRTNQSIVDNISELHDPLLMSEKNHYNRTKQQVSGKNQSNSANYSESDDEDSKSERSYSSYVSSVTDYQLYKCS